MGAREYEWCMSSAQDYGVVHEYKWCMRVVHESSTSGALEVHEIT